MGRGQRDWLAPNALLDGSSLLFILFIFICFSCPDLFIYWECAVTRILQNNNRPATQAQRRPTADLQVPPQTLRTLAPAHKRNASPPSLLYSTLPLAPPNCACAVSPHPSVKHTSVASNRIFAQLCSKYPPPFPRAPRVVLPDRALRLPTAFLPSVIRYGQPINPPPSPLNPFPLLSPNMPKRMHMRCATAHKKCCCEIFLLARAPHSCPTQPALA